MDKSTVSDVTTAVHRLAPITPAYMHVPIQEGFNWNEAFAEAAPGEWYLVVFRSQHKQGTDYSRLLAYDERAVEDARHTPGFIYYFAGDPCPLGHCVSFCLWQDRQSAVTGTSHDAHRSAASLAGEYYAQFTLERHRVIKPAADEPLRFEKH